MSLLAEKGTWTAGGSTPETITLANGSLTPVAILCWVIGPGAINTFGTDLIFSKGFGTRRGGTTQSGCVGIFSDHAVATTDTGRVRSTTLLHVLASATATDYTVSLDSFGAGQFTVSYSSAANASGDIFHYLVIGGADATDAIVLNWTMDAVAGAEVITGAGFQPDVLFALDADLATTDTITAGANYGFGFASSATLFNSCALAQTDGDTMTSTMNWIASYHTNACLTRLTYNADTLNAQWDLDTFDSDGASLGVVDAPADTDRIATFLFIKGGSWEAGSIAGSTSNGDQTITLTNTALVTRGLLQHSSRRTSTGITTTGETIVYGGAGTGAGASVQGVYGLSGLEAINTNARRFHDTGEVITIISSIPSVSALATISTLNTGNVVINWNPAIGVAFLIGFLAFGDSPAAGGDPEIALIRGGKLLGGGLLLKGGLVG